ncbi:tryptophan--tRNA ligase [Candidatus Giovannonibacteria bacterium]|nr:tryptophan--tRNA ligase [Candidatus Giovannonibacteria bacterium]
MAVNKKIAVSGVRPSGELHLGNYLGAIKQFVELQKKYKTFFFIADLHAITEPQDPKNLSKQTLDIATLYLACGLKAKETVLFVQSHVPAHVELGWMLNTITPLGELERMTQFKEKSERQGLLAGLLNYPVQMAADILLYQAEIVPVGEDQVQHLELARTLARKFNTRFGNTFKEPQALLRKEGARVMGLDDPSKKMSKSAPSANNYIGVFDDPENIRRKIKIAVTDSGKEIVYDPTKKPGISNLLVIMSQISDTSVKELEAKYKNKSYGEFKNDLAEALVQKLSPIQKKYRELSKNPKKILTILKRGAEDANKIASQTLLEAKRKMGFLI